MANPTCSVSTLIESAKCYQNLDLHERLAMLVYLNVRELEEIGGTGYVGALTTTLVEDSACYKNLTLDQNNKEKTSTAELVIAFNNAVSAGANLTTLDAQITAARCLFNFPMGDLSAMWIMLQCKLGVHKDYPQ